MVISKVDKKEKTSVIELTVGCDHFTSIFKEIKDSLQQLKDSNPQDVFKLIDKESYKAIKENNKNSIIDWKLYDTDVNKEHSILFTKPYSSSVKNKQFDGFYIYYSFEDKQFHLATSLSDVEEKIVRFEKVLDTKNWDSRTLSDSTAPKKDETNC